LRARITAGRPAEEIDNASHQHRPDSRLVFSLCEPAKVDFNQTLAARRARCFNAAIEKSNDNE